MTNTPTQRTGLYALIDKIQKTLEESSPGDRAHLHRMNPDDPSSFTTTFWRFVVLFHSQSIPLTPERERKWAILLKSMSKFEVFHQPGRRLGWALAPHLSELRLTQFLHADNDKLALATRSVVSLLAARGTSLDFGELAWFLFTTNTEKEDRVRRQIAMDFFRVKNTSESP